MHFKRILYASGGNMRSETLRGRNSSTVWIGALHTRTCHFQERLVRRPKACALSRVKHTVSSLLAGPGSLSGNGRRARRIALTCNNISSALQPQDGNEDGCCRTLTSTQRDLDRVQQEGCAHSGHTPLLWCFAVEITRHFALVRASGVL